MCAAYQPATMHASLCFLSISKLHGETAGFPPSPLVASNKQNNWWLLLNSKHDLSDSAAVLLNSSGDDYSPNYQELASSELTARLHTPAIIRAAGRRKMEKTMTQHFFLQKKREADETSLIEWCLANDLAS